jgi:hypothetical protein
VTERVEHSDAARRRRRWLLLLAGLTTLFGVLHHVDHLARFNHVGWPWSDTVSAFTFGLLVYPFLLVGFALLAVGRAVPLYWAAVGIASSILVATTHLAPDPAEPLRDVVRPYDNGLIGALAVSVLVALLASTVALTITAAAFAWRSAQEP